MPYRRSYKYGRRRKRSRRNIRRTSLRRGVKLAARAAIAKRRKRRKLSIRKKRKSKFNFADQRRSFVGRARKRPNWSVPASSMLLMSRKPAFQQRVPDKQWAMCTYEYETVPTVFKPSDANSSTNPVWNLPVIRANSPYDPENAIGGKYANGFATYAGKYGYYRCTSGHMRMTISPPNDYFVSGSTGHSNPSITIGVCTWVDNTDSDIFPEADFDKMALYHNVTCTQVTWSQGRNNKKLVHTHSWRMKDMIGEKSTLDYAWRCGTGANPDSVGEYLSRYYHTRIYVWGIGVHGSTGPVAPYPDEYDVLADMHVLYFMPTSFIFRRTQVPDLEDALPVQNDDGPDANFAAGKSMQFDTEDQHESRQYQKHIYPIAGTPFTETSITTDPVPPMVAPPAVTFDPNTPKPR